MLQCCGTVFFPLQNDFFLLRSFFLLLQGDFRRFGKISVDLMSRYGKTDPGACPGWAVDHSVAPDQTSGAVQQRAARVARINAWLRVDRADGDRANIGIVWEGCIKNRTFNHTPTVPPISCAFFSLLPENEQVGRPNELQGLHIPG